MNRQIFAIIPILVLFISLFSFASVIAESENSGNSGDRDKGAGNSGSSYDDSTGESHDDEDDDEDDEDELDEDDEKLKTEVKHEFINEDGKRVTIKTKTKIEDGKEVVEYKIMVKGDEVNSKLEIKEVIEGNETTLKVKTRGDVEQAINYLPDEVAEIARAILGSSDLNIFLEEKIHKNVPKVVYNIETNKNGRFLGIFKLKVKVEAQIDPETGELMGVSKPWWAFLIIGEDSDQVEVGETPIDNGEIEVTCETDDCSEVVCGQQDSPCFSRPDCTTEGKCDCVEVCT